jgi:hypothetical protein
LGEINNGKSRFYDFTIAAMGSTSFNIVSGKTRHTFAIEILNFGYSGGDYLTPYNLAANLQITITGGYTATVVSETPSTSIEKFFELEFDPDLPETTSEDLSFEIIGNSFKDGLSGDNVRLSLIEKAIGFSYEWTAPVPSSSAPPSNTSSGISSAVGATDNNEGELVLSPLIESQGAKSVYTTGSILLIVSSPFCSNLGFAFIKLFQIVEILSKMIFLPVVYPEKINSVLSAIADLSDPIELPSDFLIKGSLEQSHPTFKGKIFKFGEFGNIL